MKKLIFALVIVMFSSNLLGKTITLEGTVPFEGKINVTLGLEATSLACYFPWFDHDGIHFDFYTKETDKITAQAVYDHKSGIYKYNIKSSYRMGICLYKLSYIFMGYEHESSDTYMSINHEKSELNTVYNHPIYEDYEDDYYSDLKKNKQFTVNFIE